MQIQNIFFHFEYVKDLVSSLVSKTHKSIIFKSAIFIKAKILDTFFQYIFINRNFDFFLIFEK